MLNIIHTGLVASPLLDGQYEARVFPCAVIFNTPNPLLGSTDSRVAVHISGQFNVDPHVGVAGKITISRGCAVDVTW